jgi:hypothetical protein
VRVCTAPRCFDAAARQLYTQHHVRQPECGAWWYPGTEPRQGEVHTSLGLDRAGRGWAHHAVAPGGHRSAYCQDGGADRSSTEVGALAAGSPLTRSAETSPVLLQWDWEPHARVGVHAPLGAPGAAVHGGALVAELEDAVTIRVGRAVTGGGAPRASRQAKATARIVRPGRGGS